VQESGWRSRLARIIYESDTTAGWLFDVGLLLTIVASVLLVMLETVPALHADYGQLFRGLEWVFTGLFILEYGLRLVVARSPWNYARSFFGLIDLLAIFPTLVEPFVPGAQHLLVIRALRLLRVFRVLKLVAFLREANVLLKAIVSSMRKILIFFLLVVVLALIFGTLMYVVEGPGNGFDSVPAGVYWAIVTITTVGFGDITPVTTLGRAIASLIMLTGYAIIAVPTGIMTVELGRAARGGVQCPHCHLEGHALDALFCRGCGTRLS
jgi:voltage-gated potassium channel